MRIEWDEEKNVRNQRKHGGLDFETASKVFGDPHFVLLEDRIDDEQGSNAGTA